MTEEEENDSSSDQSEHLIEAVHREQKKNFEKVFLTSKDDRTTSNSNETELNNKIPKSSNEFDSDFSADSTKSDNSRNFKKASQSSSSRSASSKVSTKSKIDRVPPSIDLNDPQIIEAYQNLGFIPDDLKYPSELDINVYTRDPAFRQVVQDKLCKEIDHRIEQVQAEAERLSKTQKENDGEDINNDKKPHMSYYSLDQKRMEKNETRNKKEVEQLILNALIKKYQAEDLNQKERIEAEKRLKAENEKKIKKAA